MSMTVAFEPPLYLQRQTAVHETLKALAATQRFAGILTRIADVGCGECQFVRRLIPCDDALPLAVMTGVDVDERLLDSELSAALSPEGYYGIDAASERWYGLDVRVLLGSFEHMRLHSVGHHDVIVAIEGSDGW